MPYRSSHSLSTHTSSSSSAARPARSCLAPSRPIHRLSGFALALILLLPTLPALATTYSVGNDAGCTHASLETALNAAVADATPGPHLVKVVQGTRVIYNHFINNPAQDIVIRGGYSQCADAEPDAAQFTILNTQGVSGRRVLRIHNNNVNPRRFVELSRLILIGGLNPSEGLPWGGGVYASGRVTVSLTNETAVVGNSAQNGGGIGLFNLTSDPDQFTRLHLASNSRICENQAGGAGSNGNGGGVYALGGTEVTMRDTALCANSARRHGGGLYLASQHDHLVLDPSGEETVSFADNSAGSAGFDPDLGFGGAIYSLRGIIRYGSGSTPVNRRSLRMVENSANFGGAVYAEGSATAGDPFVQIDLRNALLGSNNARGRGGAIHLKNAVELRLVNWGAASCSTGTSSAWPCVEVFNNSAGNESFPSNFGGGGAAFLEHDTGASRPVLRVAGALFTYNRDPNGTAAVVDARGDSSVRILRSIFAYNSAGGAEIVRALIESRSNTLFGYNTVLDNSVTRLFYQQAVSTINATGSILHSPGAAILGISGNLVHNGCLLTHTDSGIPAGATVGHPLLGDGFAPRPRSPAIDHCNVASGDVYYSGLLDAYGLSVPVDIPSIPNAPFTDNGYDLGAVEQRDVLFYNGFGTRPNH